MLIASAILFVSNGLLAHPQPSDPPGTLPLDEKAIRTRLNQDHLQFAFPDFEKLGERAFPIYESILRDDKANQHELSALLSVLTYVKVGADRSRFLDPTTRLLAHKSASVKFRALDLLARIGRAQDCTPVAVLISDTDHSVSYMAAKCLAAIGGERELIALDVWLANADHHGNKERTANVTKFRGELKARLAKKPTPDRK